MTDGKRVYDGKMFLRNVRLLINHHGSLVHTYFLTDKAVFLTDDQNAFGCMVVSIINFAEQRGRINMSTKEIKCI